MATRNKPLMSAVALASAAAVAVATPAIAPSITNTITPPALSTAKVNLANFADLMSITAADWNYTYFNGWGGAIGPINVDPETVENDYWLPNCNYDCTIPGVSGIGYLALDALINGNGQGINDASNWGVSAVNYMFEGGFITGVQYIVQKPFLTEGSPLYNPAIANLIALAFQGEYALTTIYVTALSTVAQLASTVPYIGEYLYRGIGSYIGPAFQTVDSVYDYSYYAGISGILRYIGGVITTGGNPNPYPLLQEAAAPAAAKVPAVTAASAVETAVRAVSGTPAATAEATPAEAVKVEAVSTETTATPAESASSTATAATESAATTAVEATPADAAGTVADAVTTAAPATKPAAAPKTRKRPVRDAVAGAAKAVTSAVSGAAKAATGGGAAAKADSAASTN
ncbi:MAG TPA: hypothetical protein PLH92_16875 [Mycobacterium sp.]|nr:hypothetical protein [Mycobacterium sp.]